MKAIDKLREVVLSLEDSGIESAAQDAEILLRHGLHMGTVEIYRDNPILDNEQIQSIETLVQRRREREPLHYILGFVEFLGLKLLVGPGVLIPRPETEFMAEQAIKTVHRQPSKINRGKVLDVCTGTGCLALAVAKEFSGYTVCGTDISCVALNYATLNAEMNGIRNVSFLNGSLYQPLEKSHDNHCVPLQFDLIVSNPPYIKRNEINTLQPEIKNWEPVSALDGGPDGLIFFRELIPASRRYLKKNGLIMLELGLEQHNSVAAILDSEGFTQIKIIKDYAGIERIILAQCRK
jgi:release factor glutamine methyltransferase